MVQLHLSETVLSVELLGLHKLWALKTGFDIPRGSIRRVRRMQASEITGLWKGWRFPGTHLPGVFVAGTYYSRGERHFWDVRDVRHAIAVELSDGPYDRLFLEVQDPEAAIELLLQAGAVLQS